MPGFLLTRMELPGQVALLALPTALLASGPQRLSLGSSCSPFYYLLHEVGIRRKSRVPQQRWTESQVSQSTVRVHPDPFPLTLPHSQLSQAGGSLSPCSHWSSSFVPWGCHPVQVCQAQEDLGVPWSWGRALIQSGNPLRDCVSHLRQA